MTHDAASPLRAGLRIAEAALAGRDVLTPPREARLA
jgi:hypothetical protein